ncbi:BPTD_3080 family restriction endonuclease [Jongsikchunia kroppenstedtii]|uniref:BPTD_3080 family restriction endonuclease n=1 Tax=Jongsikchunia kroppenstedtii TaxID=1121721 RepID=UPI00036B7130|nr:DEAD/DEAH box helicase family protein [Jongsikchunia kroppenstedtii]
MTDAIENPILNSPYDPPSEHFVMGDHGPTGEIAPGRRASESFIPIAQAKKRRGAVQESLDLSMGERTERNTLINELRIDVAKWRQSEYNRATAISKKLLNHWSDPNRDNRVLFCQREAVETAIFLAEVSGRDGYRDWRLRLDGENATHNSGLPRIALKMATGSGKTVVMAMLIAWQSINKAFSPRDARFSNRFLVIAPGITIRDRLRVLQPSDPENYYAARDLIPADLAGILERAQIVITNYHAFLPRDAKEIKGVSKTTREILLAGKADPFRESTDAVAARVLRDFGSVRGEVIVINDEAHHCYQDKPMTSTEISSEEAEANADARVWFKGIQAVAKRIGVKQVYDLSATPFYLSGSGYQEGQLFSWTVSDFSLMDAIESGIVKIPRTPVDDDAAGDLVTYLHLWEYVGKELPKRKTKNIVSGEWPMPDVLSSALTSLYRSYERTYEHWKSELAQHGYTPPVFIVVCPNTLVSKLVYDWIAGYEASNEDATTYVKGNLDLFSNVVDHRLLAMPRTILVDSAQLESGEALKGDFKAAAAAEISAFKAQYRIDHPGADTEKISDEEILREVMNTVGKPGKLGAGVRCVVSVAMLTEGWDANTVSHILGIRAFRSQLLCEQVVGRGLRRRSYDVNDDGFFDPEYANIYGVPFSFIPTDRVVKDPKPLTPALEVRALEGRSQYRIEFPKVDGYRIEMPDPDLIFDTDGLPKFRIEADEVPTRTELAPIVGVNELVVDPFDHVRRQQVAFHLASRLLKRYFQTNGDQRPWHFRQLTRIVDRWITDCVEIADGRSLSSLLFRDETCLRACEDIFNAIGSQPGHGRPRMRALLRHFDPAGSTADVRFITRKKAVETVHSEVSHVVLDGIDGNTWEQITAQECEAHKSVAAYVKNDHLGFEIPYVYKGRSHRYVPDFIVRLKTRDADDPVRHLIIEVSGGQKSPGPTREKARTAREIWCPAVNNHGGFGIWGYVEITDPVTTRPRLNEAITNLYNNAAIIGDPDQLDFEERRGA